MSDTETCSRRQEETEAVIKGKLVDDGSDDEFSVTELVSRGDVRDRDSDSEGEQGIHRRKSSNISNKMEHCEDEEDEEIVLAAKNGGEDDEDEEVYELSRTPSPIDMNDDTPIMRKKFPGPNTTYAPPQEQDSSPERSPSPTNTNDDPSMTRKASSPSPLMSRKVSTPSPPMERKVSTPSPPMERKASTPSPPMSRKESECSSPPMMRKTSQPPASLDPLARSPSPDRKDSRGSHGSSSYDEERASSLSPEPTKTIQTPSSAVQSPMSPPPSSNSKNALTKIYTAALGDSDSEEKKEKSVRAKPAGDITQIYTQKLVEKQEQQANSPRTERKSMTFQRPEGMTNITQLYTAAFKEEKGKETGDKIKPQRNGDITKLYTGGLDHGPDSKFKGKPRDELTNPIKHNMATSVDKSAIMDAYNEVMADNNEVEWAAFTFDGNKLGVTATGNDFAAFKSHFGPDDRGFGYIKVKTGDEMSKRSKFVFCTWVGPNVSVMKKAKMSTDKALLKEIITNLSVELLIETAAEFTPEHFKAEVDKAGGARYGTGMRD